MIFNVLAATWHTYDSKIEKPRSYRFNRDFVRSMLAEFSEEHLIDPESVMDEINSNEELIGRFVVWLRDNRGFKTCKFWRITSNDSRGYQPLLGLGFEISDDDPSFVEWKVSRE